MLFLYYKISSMLSNKVRCSCRNRIGFCSTSSPRNHANAAFLSGLRIKVSPINTASVPFPLNGRCPPVCGCRFRIHRRPVYHYRIRDQCPKSYTVHNVNGKGLQIAVIYTDNVCANRDRPSDFFFIMCFYQNGQPEACCKLVITFELLVGKDRTDQKDRRGTDHLCFIDHIRIDGEILPQDRSGY